jgi:excisionase family DNA binding protein
MATDNRKDDSLLTWKEAMDYLRVSRSTLYRLMWSGQLTGHKVGSTWRSYRDDLHACVENARNGLSRVVKRNDKDAVASGCD